MSASDYDEAVREGFADDWRAAYSAGFETGRAQDEGERTALEAALREIANDADTSWSGTPLDGYYRLRKLARAALEEDSRG